MAICSIFSTICPNSWQFELPPKWFITSAIGPTSQLVNSYRNVDLSQGFELTPVSQEIEPMPVLDRYLITCSRKAGMISDILLKIHDS